MIFDHFEDNDSSRFNLNHYEAEQFGHQILSKTKENFETAKIAFIGIQDSLYIHEADMIREEFYQLYSLHRGLDMYDFGNFNLLDKEEFSYHQLADIVAELLERNILPIVFGGSQKVMFALQKGFSKAKQYMNAAMIASHFQFGEINKDLVTDRNYLMRICNDKDSYLFNFLQIAYQTYLVNPKAVQLMQQLNFDEMRLGRIRDDIKEAEPLLRDVDLLGVSMNALKFSETGGQMSASANGLYSEELAQLLRYAGMSDKNQCLALFDFNISENSQPELGAKLLAQSIWCFVEAFAERKREWPDQNDHNYLKYTVHNAEMNLDLVYLKSERSGRWWIQMPKDKAVLKRKFYIPCSYKDYQTALEGDIPDRWIHGFNKLS